MAREMKDSGVEWIGEIPKGWEVERLKKLFAFGKGLPITKENLIDQGILKHTGNFMRYGDDGEQKEQVKYPDIDLTSIDVSKPSFTAEGQVVALADEIAQCTHDLEDALRQNIMKKDDLKELNLIRKVSSQHAGFKIEDCKCTNDVRMTLLYWMINYLITDAYIASRGKLEKLTPCFNDKDTCINDKVVLFSAEVQECVSELSDFKMSRILQSREVSIGDSKAEYIIEQIFKAYYEHPLQLPSYILERYCDKIGIGKAGISLTECKRDPRFTRLICDHIGCMTDQYAEREYRHLYMPDYEK